MGSAGEARVAAVIEKEAVRDLLQATARLLDREELGEWGELFAPESEYELAAYSPEIRAAMSWWKTDRAALLQMLREVPDHVRDPAKRLHLVTPVSIEVSGDQATAISHFAVFRTTEEGASHVYAVGRYEDTLVKHGGRWLYAKHRVVVETRMLETFTHLPL